MEGKEALLAALRKEKITVVSSTDKRVVLAHNFKVEIEGPSLFKLLDDNHVVAPFGDARELAGFVKMDLAQRGLL